jgi:ribosomal-protein-serine acetyltransferase
MHRPNFLFPVTIGEDTSLEPLKIEQAPILFELTDGNRSYLKKWLPWLDNYRTVADSAHFIEQANSSWEQNQSLTLGVWHQTSLVGVISFHQFDWSNQTSSIGYWLAKTYQGKGIMTRACGGLVDLGFGKLGLQSITIKCAVGNLPSRKIAQRLGFSFTATKKDAEWLYDHYVDQQVYTMYAHDWLKQYPKLF